MSPSLAQSCLRRSPGGSPAVRLLCFPHAGGGASSFNAWPSELPAWVEVVRAQLPGREDRRALTARRSVSELLPEIVSELSPLFDLPLAIYGHSMGALVAFELARELRRLQLPSPLCLVVSGRRAPQAPLRVRGLHTLAEPELIQALTQMGGTIPEILSSARWRSHFFPTMQADLEVSDAYVYSPERPLDCPIYAFIGEDEPLFPRADWATWSEQTSGEFSARVLPGAHFFDRPSLSSMFREITSVLERHLPDQRSAERISSGACVTRGTGLAGAHGGAAAPRESERTTG